MIFDLLLLSLVKNCSGSKNFRTFSRASSELLFFGSRHMSKNQTEIPGSFRLVRPAIIETNGPGNEVVMIQQKNMVSSLLLLSAIHAIRKYAKHFLVLVWHCPAKYVRKRDNFLRLIQSRYTRVFGMQTVCLSVKSSVCLSVVMSSLLAQFR